MGPMDQAGGLVLAVARLRVRPFVIAAASDSRCFEGYLPILFIVAQLAGQRLRLCLCKHQHLVFLW